MQPLTHLGPAVVDEHRAVLVDVHERPGLVEGGQVERDAELHRGDADRSLDVRVGGVEALDLGPTTSDLTALEHLLPGRHDAFGVTHRLAVGRGVALGVEVAPPQVVRAEPEQRRAAAQDVLDHEHPLRAPEAAERRLRGLVGARDPAGDPDVGDPVGVVDVAQRPGEHRLGQVEAPAAVGGQRRLEGLDPAVVVEADAPLGVEAVPLAGHGEVLGAVEAQPHRAAGEGGAECRDGGQAVRLHLLAAETPAHAQALHGDLGAAQRQHVGDDLLGLRGVLRAALHEDLAALVDVRESAVGLQVEVLLARELELAAEHVGRSGEAGGDVAALDGGLGALELLSRDGLPDGDQGRLGGDPDDHRRGAQPGRLQGLPEHPAHRVAEVAHLVGEQRLVVLDPGVVDPGHVVGGEDADHARHGVRGLRRRAR